MMAQDCGRRVWIAVAVAALGVSLRPSFASAQGLGRPSRTAAGQQQGQAPAEPKVRLDQAQPHFAPAMIPVNPTDPIAVVNGEVITRQQLADATLAQHGKEILETMIARRLIEQELKKRKMEITNAEIEQEIEDVAQRTAHMGRQAWLMSLEKERGISPMQYARDIIYPTIAMRKLANGLVQVTEQDMNDAYEAYFGAKLHCRIITVARERTAIEIWEKLKNNPAGFEAIAKKDSTDEATRALGGLLTEPIARHAFPRPVSDAAFLQLVDGDPKDTDPSHKPKDGDISGVIQVNQGSWVIIRRERLDPAREFDRNDPTLRAQLYSQMYDANLKDQMPKLFNRMMLEAAIDNRLTGQVKEAREHQDPVFVEAKEAKDRELRRTGGAASPAGSASPGRSSSTPVGLPSELANPTPRQRPAGSPQQ